MQDVQFRNRNLRLAGNLYLPEGFDEREKYAAIVAVHPGGAVKEQTTGVYSRRLAEQGFVVLAFDSSYQGASEGEPHFLDDPMIRVDDVYAAVDYLTTLPFADAQRIGALGICAGGGIAVKAASIDRRIRAVGTASAVNVGAATRRGWNGRAPASEVLGVLDSVAAQRSAEAAGAEPAYAPYLPQVGDTSVPRDLQEAADYYLTPRGGHPNSQNRMLMSSLAAWAAFDAFDLVDTLLTQPLMAVAGSEAGSLWHSEELIEKAAGPKELVIVEGARHMDLYDGEGLLAAIGKLAPFFRRNL
jgi:uncharacterized protein